MRNRTQETPPLELWGGLECSIARVGDGFYDQFVETGHDRREGDLARVADAGIRTVRYPVSWERICPDGDLGRADWAWTDARLAEWQRLGVRVIAGLVHHGSGPPGHTSLIDPEFPAKLAAFARAAAERYPYITSWTPVNEPLTTARFAGLYGVWYPHGRDEQTFARALLNEILGTRAAMRAIRAAIPHAELIQTEDLGRTYSTQRLAGQASFDNARRFLTWDLLCGYVRDDYHRMWGHLLWAGVPESELRELADDPCPPDIIGINHYLTSARFLDERCERYPDEFCGTNGRERYADIEAVRVLAADAYSGVGGVMAEAWQRYRRPLALTEVHLWAYDEAEQARWLAEAWHTAQHLRESWGVDVRAVTAWSLFGAYDWNSLMTRRERVYERGLWDLTHTGAGEPPHETPVGAVARALAQTGVVPPQPGLATPGWWHRPDRLIYPVVEAWELADNPSLPMPRTVRALSAPAFAFAAPDRVAVG